MLLCGHALEHYENWLNTTTRTRMQSKTASMVELLNYLISRIKFFGYIIFLEPLSRYIVYRTSFKMHNRFKKKKMHAHLLVNFIANLMLLSGHAVEHYENWLNYVVQSILLMCTYAYYMTFLKHIYNIFDNFSIWCVAEGIANSKKC